MQPVATTSRFWANGSSSSDSSVSSVSTSSSSEREVGELAETSSSSSRSNSPFHTDQGDLSAAIDRLSIGFDVRSLPTAVVELIGVIISQPLECNMTAADRLRFRIGCDILTDTNNWKSQVPQAMAHTKIAFLVLDTLVGSKADETSEEFHRKGTEAIESEHSLFHCCMHDILYSIKLPIDTKRLAVIDVDHIFGFDDGSGFHFCPEGHPLKDKITSVFQNVNTAVWCGKYNGKFSTFFPDYLSRREIIQLILSSPVVSVEENRMVLDAASRTNFYIEIYLRRGRAAVKSAFPLMCFELPDTGTEIVELIPGLTLSRADYNKCVDTELNRDGGVRYWGSRDKNRFAIVDISKHIPQLRGDVPQGFLVGVKETR